MKCAVENCRKKATWKHKMNDMNYCSAACVRLDSRRLSKAIKLDYLTGHSTQEAHGEVSHQPSEEKNMTGTEKANQSSKEKNVKNIGLTQNAIEQRLEKIQDFDGSLVMRENFSAIEQEKTPEIQVVSSIERLRNLEGAQSSTMSLIDDSISHMHSLTTCIAQSVKEKAKSERNAYIEPQVVNAACNTAKQMAQLLNLKLKFHQEIKKK